MRVRLTAAKLVYTLPVTSRTSPIVSTLCESRKVVISTTESAPEVVSCINAVHLCITSLVYVVLSSRLAVYVDIGVEGSSYLNTLVWPFGMSGPGLGGVMRGQGE